VILQTYKDGLTQYREYLGRILCKTTMRPMFGECQEWKHFLRRFRLNALSLLLVKWNILK